MLNRVPGRYERPGEDMTRADLDPRSFSCDTNQRQTYPRPTKSVGDAIAGPSGEEVEAFACDSQELLKAFKDKQEGRTTYEPPEEMGDEDEGFHEDLPQHYRTPTHKLAMSKEIPKLVAITTEIEYERYERGVKYQKVYNQHTIYPLTRSFHSSSLPPQWISYIHPEGVRYYLKKTKTLSVVTEAPLEEPDALDRIERYIQEITDFIAQHGVELPPDPYLVLEIRRSGNCGYYFVDHFAQCLFWLDEFDFSHLVDHVRIPHTASIMGLQMKSHYWLHNELFPHLRQLSEENIHEIEDMLVYAIGDVMTSSPNSVVNYDLDTLKQMHVMVQQFQNKTPEARSKSAGGAWLIFRLLTTFYGERFITLYGEKGVRLAPSQSIYEPWANSWIFSFLTIVMMFGPRILFQKLRALTVDSIVSKVAWSKFRGRLTTEWRDTVLYATVVLTANVSFLTIQSVDEETSHLGHRSNAQRAIDFSIVTSMGAIIFGLLLLRDHQEVMSAEFVVHRSASRKGLEMLAAMYSLPYALLMWSMVSFFTAFGIVWYGSGDIVAIVLVSVTLGLVGLLLLWMVTAAYESRPYWEIWPLRWLQKPGSDPVVHLWGAGPPRSNSVETTNSELHVVEKT